MHAAVNEASWDPAGCWPPLVGAGGGVAGWGEHCPGGGGRRAGQGDEVRHTRNTSHTELSFAHGVMPHWSN